MESKFLTAVWKNLVMANYIVDPSILKPYLPFKTELDFYNRHTYVSLVGFMFNNTRLMGFKVPFHVNFEEVNLRFYVRFNDNGLWKRGVVFIKEIVPKPAISIIANTFYKEKYCSMPMKHFCSNKVNEIHTGYHWKHKGHWNRLEVTTENDPQLLEPGSEPAFISEHYWGYSRYNERTTNEYQVSHPSWKVYAVKNYVIDCAFESLYGPAFSFLKSAEPNSVFMAQGSPVSVSNKRVLR